MQTTEICPSLTLPIYPEMADQNISDDKLVIIARIAKKYDVFFKITAGRRVDVLGIRARQLDDIKGELTRSGIAYQ